MNKNELPLYMTVEEVAELLRVSRSAAYEYVRRGDIPSIRIGRFIRVPRDLLLSMKQNFELPQQNNSSNIMRGGTDDGTWTHKKIQRQA